MDTSVEGEALQCFISMIKEGGEESYEESVSVCDGGGSMVLQMKVDILEPIVEHMPPEPKNRQQAVDSPEWEEWWKAEEVEMHGKFENCAYKQVARPKDKLVVGTKKIYKRKIGQDDEVENYQCRLVIQGFWQVVGVYYMEKYLPTPPAVSRKVLATEAAEDGELRCFDAEQAVLKADIDGDTYIKITTE